MHTNDTASTVARLTDMGIEPYIVSSAIAGVVAQRLVRKICTSCREKYIPSSSEKNLLNIDDDVLLYRGKGCSYCNDTGYRGRTAIHEIMPIIKEIRMMIDNRESADIIREVSRKNGTISLYDNCRELVLTGVTTIDEMLKVTYTLE